MGSGESTTRKVSFGVDDEDRVRILRGVKLSEDVLQRMRGVANIAPERSSSTSSAQKDTGASRNASSSSRPQQNPQHRAQPNTQSSSSKPDSYTKEEQRRYEQQQTILKEELAKVAQREREAAMQEMTKAKTRERHHTRLEAERAKQLPITLSFLPWRQYYQCSASGKLHPESFLELEIGLVQGWRYSHGKGRACFTHQRVPVSRDSSLPLLLVHLPPPVLKHAVAPVLSPLQHTPTPNRKPLEGRREQNDQSSRTGPADAECSS